MSEAVHELKTWPTYWDAVARGEKLFEVRKNDRFFQCGDIVHLLRLSKDSPVAGFTAHDGYSSPETSHACYAKRLTFSVGPVLQGGQFGIEPGYCVFSLLPLPSPPQETQNDR